MKKIILGIVISLIVLGCEKNKQLTTQQKVKDFEYLYQSLKENYPYFGVAKRTTGIDWLENKEKYLTEIEKTNNDKEYIVMLDSILRDLGSGHVDLSPTAMWQYWVPAYKEAIKTEARFEKWVKALEDPKARPLYWQKVLEIDEQTGSSMVDESVSTYKDSIIAGDKIGIMRIQSFDIMNAEKEAPLISDFLNKTADFKYLIIDIQRNGGGAELYWKNNIVSKLIHDTIQYPSYFVLKDGALNRYYYPNYLEHSTIVKKAGSLQNIPPELLDGTYHMTIETDTIIPDKPVDFKGKLYLLVNRGVFSSAESFACFCKSTHFATVAGVRTGGEGIGEDPILVTLPESGIIVRFPVLTGFNHDGNLNAEERTVPDIPLNGKNADERLQELIDLIRTK